MRSIPIRITCAALGGLFLLQLASLLFLKDDDGRATGALNDGPDAQVSPPSDGTPGDDRAFLSRGTSGGGGQLRL